MRYILLDRDGTLIEERHYLARPDGVFLVPGAAAALKRLRELGWGAILVSNQSGVGRGRLTREQVEAIHAHLERLLARHSARLDAIYYCPHHPDERCRCRKPRPDLVRSAARDLGFDPSQCVVVGDKPADLELGKRVGARTILVRTGYGSRTEQSHRHLADAVVDSIAQLPALLDPTRSPECEAI
jgi:histidinol-phosphate phosphatase family protein